MKKCIDCCRMRGLHMYALGVDTCHDCVEEQLRRRDEPVRRLAAAEVAKATAAGMPKARTEWRNHGGGR